MTAGTAPATGRPATGRPATVRKAGHQGASRRQATSLEQERLREVDRRGVVLGLMTAGAAVAVGSVIALCSQAGGPAVDESIPATGRVVEATVTVSGMRFVPDTVDVAPGDRLVITLDNTADMVHDLVLENGATTGRVSAGQRAELDAGVIRGPVEGWCSIAGHRAHGMVFHVTTGAAPVAAPGASASTPTSAVPDYEAPLPQGFTAFDAALAPAPSQTTHRHTFTVTEVPMPVGCGVTQTRMTYNGQVPAPVLRGKVGDTFEITLVNNGTMSHSLDFHAGVVSPDAAMRSISPGESLVYTFTAQRSGIWLYHCSTMPMSLHLASGMHGAVIIDPPTLAEVDHEYLLVHSEIYLGPEGGPTDAAKVVAKTPDLTVFNGVAFQYVQQPLTARTGQRVRFWVLDAGPSLLCSFHVVGLQFDTVFFEGAYQLGGPEGIGTAWNGGSQALGLHPAQGGFVETVAGPPGSYTFVNHSFADAEKGATGILRVSE